MSTSSQWFTILCFSPGLIYNFQFFDGISICLCICGNRDDGEFLDLWVYGDLWTSSSAWCCFSGVMLHRGCRSYKTCQLARSPCNLPLRVYIFNAVYSIYASPRSYWCLKLYRSMWVQGCKESSRDRRIWLFSVMGTLSLRKNLNKQKWKVSMNSLYGLMISIYKRTMF